MIQRKQSLFFLELFFLSLALLFVPNTLLLLPEQQVVRVCLLPIGSGFVSTPCHYAVMIINFLNMLLAIVTLFMYKKRGLQIKLSYLMAVLWAILICVIAFCPLVEKGNDVMAAQVNHSSTMIGLFAILAAVLAARFIRKDIDLLRSADRLR